MSVIINDFFLCSVVLPTEVIVLIQEQQEIYKNATYLIHLIMVYIPVYVRGSIEDLLALNTKVSLCSIIYALNTCKHYYYYDECIDAVLNRAKKFGIDLFS